MYTHTACYLTEATTTTIQEVDYIGHVVQLRTNAFGVDAALDLIAPTRESLRNLSRSIDEYLARTEETILPPPMTEPCNPPCIPHDALRCAVSGLELACE